VPSGTPFATIEKQLKSCVNPTQPASMYAPLNYFNRLIGIITAHSAFLHLIQFTVTIIGWITHSAMVGEIFVHPTTVDRGRQLALLQRLVSQAHKVRRATKSRSSA
jgi:hypothetical protein